VATVCKGFVKFVDGKFTGILLYCEGVKEDNESDAPGFK